MNEQRKYEVIKGLVDHPDTANKDRAALILGCTKRHINRMIQLGIQLESSSIPQAKGRIERLNQTLQ